MKEGKKPPYRKFLSIDHRLLGESIFENRRPVLWTFLAYMVISALYAGIDGAKFKASVFPGDTVCVESKEVTQRGPLVVVDAQATVNGKLCCKGRLTFMLVPNDKLNKE